MTVVAGPRKFAFIDAARGIAILMVILVHATSRSQPTSPLMNWLGNYGNMGVQLFFVASAYTLCLSHIKRKSEPNALRSYFIRRYFRIAPLYYLAIILYLCLNLYRGRTDPSVLNNYSAVNLLANLFFVHGLVPSASITMVPGGWSIGAEMLFYLLFPAMFWIAQRLENWKANASALLILAAMLIDLTLQARFWTSAEPHVVNNSFMYGHIINQLSVFSLGIFIFFHEGRLTGAPRFGISLFQFLATTAIAMAIRLFDFPFTFAFTPILSGISFFFLLRLLRIIENPNNLLCAIGRVSFSMYIFHFPIVHYASDIMNRLRAHGATGDMVLIGTYSLGVVATYMVATLSQRFIEARGIQLGNGLIKKLNAARSVTPLENERVSN